MTRPTTILFAALLVLASCTSARPEQAEVAAEPPTSTTAATTTTTSSAPPTTPPTTAPSTTAPPTTVPACVRIDDFGEGAELRWTVRNDGVMGGLSVGSVSFADSTMTFDGTINTNGGGFSSVVYDVPLGALDGAVELRLRTRSDGRNYELLADDALEGRDRRVTHYAPFESGSEWREVTVPLTDMAARLFGTPVIDAPFQPDLAVEVGILLGDGIDGDFRMEIDWIDACGATS